MNESDDQTRARLRFASKLSPTPTVINILRYIQFSACSTVVPHRIVLSLNSLDRHQDDVDDRDRTCLMHTPLGGP
jgi:hypothetical protein